MSNICYNEFYCSSDNKENIDYVEHFLETKLDADIYDIYSDSLNATFDSRWTFPEHLMEELYEGVPDKETIYMRCLSVEYGCLYHELWVCEEEGWSPV